MDRAAPQTSFTADCTSCAALCCFVLPFDKSAAFGFDKAAGVPCPHLQTNLNCAIHATLKPSGFSGCVAFDCHGAGQRVTQAVFGGRSWRDDPALAGPMEDAFRAMRKLHEAALMLTKAADLPLTDLQESQRQAVLAALDPDRARTHADLIAFESGPDLHAVRQFLASLKPITRRSGSPAI